MGSIVRLGIGHLELDWGKNGIDRNHSKLFMPNDIKDIPYFYANNIVEYKQGYARRLADIKRRLELLGYSLNRLDSLFTMQIAQIPSYLPKPSLTFKEFANIISALDIEKINLPDGDEYDLGEFVSQYLFLEPEFRKITGLKGLKDRNSGEIFENLDPYITLRILMENPKNADKELMWRYADVLEGGWVDKDEIYQQLEDRDKILLVTEGTSDSFIIRKALEFLCPDIKDFFYFVDMEKNYPFTGTGNLYRFAQGLSSINIQNNVLIIYDNDLEGNSKYEQSRRLKLPTNLKVIKLPDYDDFSSFSVSGPNGLSESNINGLAVSIECFLDLKYHINIEPCIRWTTYDPKTNMYQGELVNKEKYVSIFSQVKANNRKYDFSKLAYLLNHIYHQWTSTSA